MKIPFYQVDAFAEKPFSGNPAAVCILKEYLPDSILQSIAAENNLSETAFVVSSGKDFQLRWFTPNTEVDLCGHATLAAAHILLDLSSEKKVRFTTRSGLLTVRKNNDLLEMELPAWEPESVELIREVTAITGHTPLSTWRTRDLLAVYPAENIIEAIDPDLVAVSKLDFLGLIISAPGSSHDFVSRFFAPRAGVDEDPVTGSAHSTLVPFWSKTLGKKKMSAIQLSKRKGVLSCEYLGDRIILSGHAVTVIKGEFSL